MTPKKSPDAATRRQVLLRGLATTAAGGLGGLLAGCGGAADEPASPDAAPSSAEPQRRRGLGGVDGGGTGSPMMMLSVAIDATSPLSAGGLQFDTRGAEIVDGDDQPLAEAALAAGMSSRIEASWPVGSGSIDARAHRVRTAEQLLGPVSALDLVNGRFTVLGQSVMLGARTVFDASMPRGRADLQAGAQVRVWGELDPGRALVHATRVALVPAPAHHVVRGLLKSLDRSLGSATIGGLVVRFDPAATGTTEPSVLPGDIVRARLDASAAAVPGGLLSLREDGLHLADGVLAEIEGRITSIDSPTRFRVDGVAVDASTATSREGVSTPSLGARAHVSGRSLQGLLVAASLGLEAPEPVELEGRIDRVDAGTSSFVMRGVTVVWGASTRIEGGGAWLLSARRKVAVTGYWNADGSRLLARHIHIEA